MNDIRLLNPYTLAGVLATTHEQASRLIRSGELPSVCLPNGEARVALTDVLAWVEKTKRQLTLKGIRMDRIDHQANDKKLAKQIDTFNDGVEKHEATAVAITEPPSISDDEILELTVSSLETHRQGLLSERLKHAQDSVVLCRQRIQLLEASEVEMKARADQADADYDSIHSKVSNALLKAGMGVESTHAGQTGHMTAAARQFEHQIRQTKDVRAAEAERKHHRGKLNHHIQLIATAKSGLADTQTELKTFVLQRINHDHDHERTANVAMRAVPQIEVPSRVSNQASHAKPEAAAAGGG